MDRQMVTDQLAAAAGENSLKLEPKYKFRIVFRRPIDAVDSNTA